MGTAYSCLDCEIHDGSGCLIRPGYCVIYHDGERKCVDKNIYKPGNPCQVSIKPLAFLDLLVQLIVLDKYIARYEL